MTERVPICELAIPIRWGDMDGMGHANHTVHCRCMAQCRISAFGATGIPAGPDGPCPIIVGTSSDVGRELVHPGSVIVRQYVGEFGTTGVRPHPEPVRADDPGSGCADGEARIVEVEDTPRTAVPWPDAVREAILTPRGALV